MTSLKLQDYMWMNGSSHQFWLLPAELQELEQTWRTSNFPGLSGAIGKPVSDEVQSQGCWVEIILQRTSGNLQKTSRFTLFSTGFWRQSKQSYVQVKNYCNTALKHSHLTTVKTSKINMRKADLRFTSFSKNQVGQVGTLWPPRPTTSLKIVQQPTLSWLKCVESRLMLRMEWISLGGSSWLKAHTVWWIDRSLVIISESFKICGFKAIRGAAVKTISV